MQTKTSIDRSPWIKWPDQLAASLGHRHPFGSDQNQRIHISFCLVFYHSCIGPAVVKKKCIFFLGWME